MLRLTIAGSTHVGFGAHRFSIQYVEQESTEGFQPSHRSLAVNPLYAEGQSCIVSQVLRYKACRIDASLLRP